MDDNFDIDTGIDMDPMKFDDYEEYSEDNNIQNDKNVMGVALISIVVGVVVIVIAFSLIGVANRFQGREEKTEKIENNIIDRVESRVETITSKVTIIPEKGIDINNANDWVEFKRGEGIELDKEVEALFTVTSIQHMAKVVNEKNDKIIKSIVKGNISGIAGTYEIDIPYEKAELLSDGAVFTIVYRYTMRNGTRVIGEIKY